jgi:hypothetical protein
MISFRVFWRSFRPMTLRVALAIAFASFAVIYGIQAEPTASQRETFLDTFKPAIKRNDARILDSLIYTNGMTPDLLEAHKKSMDHLVEILNANQNHFDYKWEGEAVGSVL